MKRFYTSAEVGDDDAGFTVLLDGRGIKTPANAKLLLPNKALAEEIAAEWQEQGERIDPHSMVLTGLANAAIDRVPEHRATIAREVAAYGESDMLCYRADADSPLAVRQDETWNPLLHWAERRYDIAMQVTHGVLHVPQSPLALVRLQQAVDSVTHFELAAMVPLTNLTGSLFCTLALRENFIAAEALWPIVNLEELWQAAQWGEDEVARKTRDLRRVQFEKAARFLALSNYLTR